MATKQMRLRNNIGKIGFNVYPEGAEAVYVEFSGDELTSMDAVVADYLVKMEPERFEIFKTDEQPAAAAQAAAASQNPVPAMAGAGNKKRKGG